MKEWFSNLTGTDLFLAGDSIDRISDNTDSTDVFFLVRRRYRRRRRRGHQRRHRFGRIDIHGKKHNRILRRGQLGGAFDLRARFRQIAVAFDNNRACFGRSGYDRRGGCVQAYA